MTYSAFPSHQHGNYSPVYLRQGIGHIHCLASLSPPPFGQAFRGEFTVFSPLPGCFEHFGLDFMVDEDFHVWLLEANPGPDFKQVH